nr:putative exostosin-like protein [Tanacetum cinerariifolium]
MSALEYRTILKYRLMIPLFSVDEPCPVCRKVCLDSFGEHAVHCRELPGFKNRHDLVRDVLYDVLKRAGISSKKEAPVNFLTDPLEGRGFGGINLLLTFSSTSVLSDPLLFLSSSLTSEPIHRPLFFIRAIVFHQKNTHKSNVAL